MSKRNRNRFRDRDRQASVVSSQSPLSSQVNRVPSADGAASQHAAEYKIISADMIRLVVLNAVMLAAVLAVYFTNKQSGYLEKLFEKLF
jgi:hypothetical protein